MKLVVTWLALVVSVAACSVNHRSGDYACTTQSDCDNGRKCTDGYCIVPGGNPPVDAPKTSDAKLPPDAPQDVCPAQCTTCDEGSKQCNIDCAVDSCTNGQVVCPPGWNCDVKCSTPGSCRGNGGGGTPGVICAGTLSCTVECTGDGSCRGVQCGSGPCNVDCAGTNSCSGVRCNQSCACDVTCHDPSLCTGIFCKSNLCETASGGCSSQFTTCDTCP